MTKVLVYKTIKVPIENEIPKIKGSKFIGRFFCVENVEEVEEILTKLRKNEASATHHCYAYRVWIRTHMDLFGNWIIDPEKQRANDDGEPSGTASHPMKTVLAWAELHNVLLVVTRYFGGTKLGIGGLIQAYRETSKAVLNKCEFVEKEITKKYHFSCEQVKIPTILSFLIKNNIKILEQKYDEKGNFTVKINLTVFDEIIGEIKDKI